MEDISFEKKLFIFRDTEGHESKRELRVIDRINDELCKEKSFVGIVPFGSTVLGYREGNSDLDIQVMYDSLLNDGEDEEQVLERIKRVCDKLKTEIKNEYNLEVSFQDTPLDFSFNEMLSELKEGKYFSNSRHIAWLLRLGKGPKIEYYRKQIAECFRGLPEKNISEITNWIVDSIMSFEELSIKNMCERLTKYKGKEVVLIESRKKLWEKRVKDILKKS
ncbi:MAG: nucleotidyltransferase domain-containing protein [Candidatus Nomurabacteria bacterium]|nr:nucleotidyltransferase domain-containing protein [Candidatus Nomurabacteria bacterium]